MTRSSRRFQYLRIGGLVLALTLTALPVQAQHDGHGYRRPPPRHVARRPPPRHYDQDRGSDVSGVIAGALLGLVVGGALTSAAVPPPPTVVYEEAPPPPPPPTVVYQQPGYYSQPGY